VLLPAAVTSSADGAKWLEASTQRHMAASGAAQETHSSLSARGTESDAGDGSTETVACSCCAMEVGGRGGGELPEVRDVLVVVIGLGKHDCSLRQGPQSLLHICQRGGGYGSAAEVPPNHLRRSATAVSDTGVRGGGTWGVGDLRFAASALEHTLELRRGGAWVKERREAEQNRQKTGMWARGRP
jgi:hypothetical protein